MQRHMTSPMDASLSTRNQGQLVSTQVAVTRQRRVGDMKAVPASTPTVRSLTMPQASPAQGLGEVTIGPLGTTSWKWIGASMLAGIILWKMTAGRRNKAKEALRTAAAKL